MCVCVYVYSVFFFGCVFSNQPKYIPVNNKTGQIATSDELANADNTQGGTIYESPQLFDRDFSSRSGGRAPSYLAAGLMAAYYSLYDAISIAGTTDTEIIRRTLSQLNEPSFFGTLAFGRFGDNDQHA